MKARLGATLDPIARGIAGGVAGFAAYLAGVSELASVSELDTTAPSGWGGALLIALGIAGSSACGAWLAARIAGEDRRTAQGLLAFLLIVTGIVASVTSLPGPGAWPGAWPGALAVLAGIVIVRRSSASEARATSDGDAGRGGAAC